MIYIDKESLEYNEIENARDLVRWVEERTVSGPPSYVIVDEVQILSGDLATRIAGRYVSIPIFPPVP